MPGPVDVQIPYVEHAEIVIDGQASEVLWADAPVFDDFHAYHPRPDAEVPGGSRVRVLTDSKGIYFLFEVFEPDPSQVWAARCDSTPLRHAGRGCVQPLGMEGI